mmetsp:Transcript_136271/g.236406  ORF Transcript_136271/g.236406 Transcript_136271/m.236406 type:complete len:80 (+) Transcript_136271:150-389(+)
MDCEPGLAVVAGRQAQAGSSLGRVRLVCPTISKERPHYDYGKGHAASAVRATSRRALYAYHARCSAIETNREKTDKICG